MRILNRIINKLFWEWYRIIFPHLICFDNIKQGVDALVVGGIGAFDCFDVKFGNVSKAANLTVCPTSVSYMLRIIKNYHSYLKCKGEIYLVLHPMSLCIKHYNYNEYISDDIRYYPILHNSLIESFHVTLSEKWSRSFKPQSISDITQMLKMSLNHFKYKDELAVIKNILNNNIDKNLEISGNLINIINENVLYLKDIKEFSDERGYTCNIIVMSDFLSDEIVKKYGFLLDDLFFSPLSKTNIRVIQ